MLTFVLAQHDFDVLSLEILTLILTFDPDPDGHFDPPPILF